MRSRCLPTSSGGKRRTAAVSQRSAFPTPIPTRTTDHVAHIDSAVRAMPSRLKPTLCVSSASATTAAAPPSSRSRMCSPSPARATTWISASVGRTPISTPSPLTWTALPVVAEELQFHAVGCYSAVSELKRRLSSGRVRPTSRRAHGRRWPSCGSDRPLPRSRLHTLWHELSFNQFHDTLGGCSIREAEDDAIRSLGGVASAAEQLLDDAGRFIAAAIDTTFDTGGRGSGAVVVFNPFAQPVRQYVEYEPWTEWQAWTDGAWSLADDDRISVPYQLIETHEALSSPSAVSLNRLVFPAELPPLGYRRYRFAPDLAQVSKTSPVSASPAPIAGERHPARRVRPGDRRHRLLRGQSERAWNWSAPDGWNVAQVLEDTSDTWSHGCDAATGQPIGPSETPGSAVCRRRTAAGLAAGRAYLRGQPLAAAGHPAPRRRADSGAQLAHLAGPIPHAQAGLRRCRGRPAGRTRHRPSAGARGPSTARRSRRICGWTSPAPRPANGSRLGGRWRCSTTARYGCDVQGNRHAPDHAAQPALRVPPSPRRGSQASLRLDRPGLPRVHAGTAAARGRLAGQRRGRGGRAS